MIEILFYSYRWFYVNFFLLTMPQRLNRSFFELMLVLRSLELNIPVDF